MNGQNNNDVSQLDLEEIALSSFAHAKDLLSELGVCEDLFERNLFDLQRMSK